MSRLVTPDASGLAPVARVSGEIDLANAARLHEELLAMAHEVEALVVDLTGVSYLDSAGVKALFQVARDLRQREQALFVTMPIGSPLRRVLKITGFHEVAAICDDIEAAFNLIGRRPA
jgi:anti-anti-sigma factor